MLKFLKDNNLIDIKGLLILKYKDLNLNEDEVMVLLILISLQQQGVKTITPQLLTEYMQFDVSKIDTVIVELISKQIIQLNNVQISIEPLYEKLLKNPLELEEEKKKEVNLIEAFENEFARSLSPMEMETIKEWKQLQYSDDHILLALKEATLSNVHSLRYIEKILIDWAKHGVKTSRNHRADTHKSDEKIEIVDYKWWEEE